MSYADPPMRPAARRFTIARRARVMPSRFSKGHSVVAELLRNAGRMLGSIRAWGLKMDVSIVICTTDRAADLLETLESLATVRRPGSTELLVVDNRSTDSTRQLVESTEQDFPYPLRYLYENEAGKYAALNTGIRAASGRIIAATDDDARFEPDWLEKAVDGLARYQCDFVGGRVRPLWGGPKPAWLAETNGLHTKVIALLDHGDRV